MAFDDIPEVQAIERASFTTPWPPQAYDSELRTNRLAHYRVVRAGERIVAFGGIWLMVDEAHITTFAVHPAWRRRRLGARLLLALIDLAIERRAREATLEVRLSNMAARRLYEQFGFRPVGLRPRYYTDDQEDALVMTTEELTGPAMTERLAGLRPGLEAAEVADEPGRPAADAADQPTEPSGPPEPPGPPTPPDPPEPRATGERRAGPDAEP
jgi:ribosomal-protein-alanine N-acetyltransferase